MNESISQSIISKGCFGKNIFFYKTPLLTIVFIFLYNMAVQITNSPIRFLDGMAYDKKAGDNKMLLSIDFFHRKFYKWIN